jgi:hypothetical protein
VKPTEYVNDHCEGKHKDGPLISVTPDLVRAFKLMFKLALAKNTNIALLVIDGWELQRHGAYVIPCNELRQRVGLPEDNVHKSEFIVWAEIPVQAIVCEWSWESLQDSGLFDIFPVLIKVPPKIFLEALREALRCDKWWESEQTVAYIVKRMVEVLVDRLKMPPSKLITLQIAIIMLGWSRGHSWINWYPTLQETIEQSIEQSTSSGFRLLEEELHKRQLILGLEQMAEYTNTGHFRSTCRMLDFNKFEKSMNQYFRPTFESWWTLREDMDSADWESCEGFEYTDRFRELLNSL